MNATKNQIIIENHMSNSKKGYKITIYKNGRFCWVFERTKGISDNDKKAVNIPWFFFIILGWFISDVVSAVI